MKWDNQNTIHLKGSAIILRHRVGREQGQDVGNLLQSFIEPLGIMASPLSQSGWSCNVNFFKQMSNTW